MTSSILVLEDDSNFRELVVETLQDEGYDAREADSPALALEAARRYRFHLLLTDVRMAGEMDGVGVLERLKALRPGLKSIIMTGYASEEVPARAMRLQADDYLLKAQFGVPELLQVVRRVLEQGTTVESVWSRAAGLLKLPLKRLAEARLGELEAARKALFGHYFLAVRPAHLSCEAAYPFWIRLEELEERFRQVEAPAQVTPLVQAYLALSQDLIEGRPAPRPPAHASPTPSDFRRLYDLVRAGSVSVQELQEAPRLRQDAQNRKASVFNFTLYSRLWGGPAPELPTLPKAGDYLLTERLDETRYRARGPGDSRHLVEIVQGAAQGEVAVYRESHEGTSLLVRPWSDHSQTLRAWLVPGGIPAAELVPMLRTLFQSVYQAHQAGRHDGGLNLQRVVLTPQGPVIPHFGAGTGDARCLNLSYLDPALLAGRPVDPLADQYSLGRMTFELWSGHRSAPPPADDPHRDAFEAALARLQSADPGARYPDVRQAYLALAVATGVLVPETPQKP